MCLIFLVQQLVVAALENSTWHPYIHRLFFIRAAGAFVRAAGAFTRVESGTRSRDARAHRNIAAHLVWDSQSGKQAGYGEHFLLERTRKKQSNDRNRKSHQEI